MDPKKITGCSQPYDIEELIVPLWDADVSSINQFFDQAGAMIGRYFINYLSFQRVYLNCKTWHGGFQRIQ